MSGCAKSATAQQITRHFRSALRAELPAALPVAEVRFRLALTRTTGGDYPFRQPQPQPTEWHEGPHDTNENTLA